MLRSNVRTHMKLGFRSSCCCLQPAPLLLPPPPPLLLQLLQQLLPTSFELLETVKCAQHAQCALLAQDATDAACRQCSAVSNFPCPLRPVNSVGRAANHNLVRHNRASTTTRLSRSFHMNISELAQHSPPLSKAIQGHSVEQNAQPCLARQ